MSRTPSAWTALRRASDRGYRSSGDKPTVRDDDDDLLMEKDEDVPRTPASSTRAYGDDPFWDEDDDDATGEDDDDATGERPPSRVVTETPAWLRQLESPEDRSSPGDWEGVDTPTPLKEKIKTGGKGSKGRKGSKGGKGSRPNSLEARRLASIAENERVMQELGVNAAADGLRVRDASPPRDLLGDFDEADTTTMSKSDVLHELNEVFKAEPVFHIRNVRKLKHEDRARLLNILRQLIECNASR